MLSSSAAERYSLPTNILFEIAYFLFSLAQMTKGDGNVSLYAIPRKDYALH